MNKDITRTQSRKEVCKKKPSGQDLFCQFTLFHVQSKLRFDGKFDIDFQMVLNCLLKTRTMRCMALTKLIQLALVMAQSKI